MPATITTLLHSWWVSFAMLAFALLQCPQTMCMTLQAALAKRSAARVPCQWMEAGRGAKPLPLTATLLGLGGGAATLGRKGAVVGPVWSTAPNCQKYQCRHLARSGGQLTRSHTLLSPLQHVFWPPGVICVRRGAAQRLEGSVCATQPGPPANSCTGRGRSARGRQRKGRWLHDRPPMTQALSRGVSCQAGGWAPRRRCWLELAAPRRRTPSPPPSTVQQQLPRLVTAVGNSTSPSIPSLFY